MLVFSQFKLSLPEDHFPRVEKLVAIGTGAKRDIGDIYLSRYACYLIVQNADPSKEVVALGQTYFAVQTRKQEIQEHDFGKIQNEDEKSVKKLESPTQKKIKGVNGL